MYHRGDQWQEGESRNNSYLMKTFLDANAEHYTWLLGLD
jgi:hypothetical protein